MIEIDHTDFLITIFLFQLRAARGNTLYKCTL